MLQMQAYIREFFDSLTVGVDERDNQCYNVFMREAALRFIARGDTDAAYEVYRIFFECYNLEIEGGGASFLSLLEKLRHYEENAATLINKQRDHFVHSVNVFLLGLSVYAENRAFRNAFRNAFRKEEAHRETFDTITEEFFFRWGMAALCHDIGYPIEIITNQINEFVQFTGSIDPGEPRIISRIEYDNFGVINSIPEKIAKKDFIREFYDKHDECVYIDLLKPIDLMAFRVSQMLSLDVRQVKNKLDSYLSESARQGRIDHGFFSALTLLKWYGYLIQTSGIEADKLYYPVLDSATAILLHNFYAVGLQKPPFSLGPIQAETYPLAFLLILSDELQEWNRRAYGALDKLRRHALGAHITMDDSSMQIVYSIERGMSAEGYAGAKYLTFQQLLDDASIFPDGIRITCEYCETPESMRLMREIRPSGNIPMPLTRNLRQIAEAQLAAYNAMFRSLNPDAPIAGETIEALSDLRKHYFLSEALELPTLLGKINCELRPFACERSPVTAFTDAEVDVLAENMHARWMRLHLEDGWVYAKTTDRKRKKHHCLVAYHLLTDAEKELDRAPARALPDILRSVGIGVYRQKHYSQPVFTDSQIDALARKAHALYLEQWREDHPGETPPYSDDFDALSEDTKLANYRQARSIPDKLSQLSCLLLPKGTEGFGAPITAFTDKEVERLAKIEHDEWTGERLLHGWQYGFVRNNAKKENPYMVPYKALSETLKDYDRAPIRAIPAVVDALGYAIFRVE